MLLGLAPRTELHEPVAPAVAAIYDSAHLVPYLAMGMLGLVLGMILLGVTLLRARFGPLWLGVAPILFVVAEFGLSGLSEWAFYAAGLLFAASMVGMAVVTLRRGALLDDGAHRRSVVRHVDDDARQVLDAVEPFGS